MSNSGLKLLFCVPESFSQVVLIVQCIEGKVAILKGPREKKSRICLLALKLSFEKEVCNFTVRTPEP